MRFINIIIILIIFGFTSLFCQTRYQFEIDLGTGFQDKVKLDNQYLDNSNTFAMRFGANIQIPIHNKVCIEIGAFGKYNRSSNDIETLVFKSNSLRLQIPLYIGYKLNDKWKTNIGVSIENNRDFDTIDFQKENNLRYDFLSKIIYQYSDQIHFVFYSNWSLINVPDFFNISNPKNGIFLGIIYQLKKKDEN